MKLSKSKKLYEEGKSYIPGGCSSFARVGHWFDPFNLFMKNGQGSKMWDIDGNEYIDYLIGYGALILGHRHPKILEAIKKQIENGTIFGTLYDLEVKAAKKVCKLVPCADKVAFCNSGTEATMHAIRIARAYTGKDKIIKFEGHYHGHHDYVLFSIVSVPPITGLEWAPHKLPYFPGIPEVVSQSVIVAPWNDLSSLERILKKNSNDVAALIMEPIMANNTVILPKEGYLKGVRELTEKYDTVLIFDEVFTGFRVALGGAQEHFGVKPDMACFAKALGGGVPIAAVAGIDEIMRYVRPGKISIAGTYNANPLSLAACLATLEELSKNDGAPLKKANSLGKKLMKGLQQAVDLAGQEAIIEGPGVMFQMCFTKLEKITSYRQVNPSTFDFMKFKRFHDEMLQKGMFFHPDPGERIMLSTAHTKKDIDKTLTAAEDVLKKLPKETVTVLP